MIYWANDHFGECLYLNKLQLHIPNLDILSGTTIRSIDQNDICKLFIGVFDVIFNGKKLNETKMVKKLWHICMLNYFIAKNIK